METQIIVLFCIIDDFLKAIQFKDDIQVVMTTAEVVTVALGASIFFSGNHEKSRLFFKDHRYFKKVLSKSQFNRRLHAIESHIWQQLQAILSQVFQQTNDTQEYVIDSFPVAVCHNIRINRCKIFTEEKYRGYCASKREYFFGVRVHMIISKTGGPVEFILAPGSFNDVKVLNDFDMDLPSGAKVYGDAIYNDYEYEDLLKESTEISFIPIRKSNSLRPHEPFISFILGLTRKRVETVFSTITRFFPHKIHAVTAKGFHLKIVCFILAYSITLL